MTVIPRMTAAVAIFHERHRLHRLTRHKSSLRQLGGEQLRNLRQGGIAYEPQDRFGC